MTKTISKQLESMRAANVISTRGNIWRLCPKAEPRLMQAVEDGALIVVNGLMAVKGLGETIGIPLVSVDLEGGTTDQAGWYEPTDHAQRMRIRTAFFQGKTTIHLEDVTAWTWRRKVVVDRLGLTGVSLAEMLHQAVDRLEPGRTMPRGLSRESYRLWGDAPHIPDWARTQNAAHRP